MRRSWLTTRFFDPKISNLHVGQSREWGELKLGSTGEFTPESGWMSASKGEEAIEEYDLERGYVGELDGRASAG